jgi:hypothetical protein
MSRLGAEDLQWQVFRWMFDDLNDKIVEEAARQRQLDADFNALTGRRLVVVTVEQIDRANFHLGHRPSLIESPISDWPALAVMTYSSVPSPVNSNLDRADSNRIAVSIECIVNGSVHRVAPDGKISMQGGAGRGTAAIPDPTASFDAEEEVDRRLKRTAEAIHAVMTAHHDDGSQFVFSETPPTITFGEVFVRDATIDRDDTSGRVLWQGVRFQYMFDKTTWFDTDQS